MRRDGMPLHQHWGPGGMQQMRKRRSVLLGGRRFVRTVATAAAIAAAGVGLSAAAIDATASTASRAHAVPAARSVPQVHASTTGGGATVTLSGPAVSPMGGAVRLHLDVRGAPSLAALQASLRYDHRA